MEGSNKRQRNNDDETLFIKQYQYGGKSYQREIVRALVTLGQLPESRKMLETLLAIDDNCIREFCPWNQKVLSLACCAYATPESLEYLKLVLNRFAIQEISTFDFALTIANWKKTGFFGAVELLGRDPRLSKSESFKYGEALFYYPIYEGNGLVPLFEESAATLEQYEKFFQLPQVDIFSCLSFCYDSSDNEVASQILLRLILDRILTHTSDQPLVIGTNLRNNSSYNEIKTAIAQSSRLLKIKGPPQALLNLDIHNSNYSIIEIVGMHANYEALHQFLEPMLTRNRAALTLCRATAFLTALFLRKRLGHDISKVIANLVWDSRGTKIWVRE